MIAAAAARGLEALPALVHARLRQRYLSGPAALLRGVVNPVADLAVFYAVLGLLLKMPIDGYLLYLISGLIPWSFLRAGAMAGVGALTARAQVILTTPVAPLALVAADLGAELARFAAVFLAFLAGAALFAGPPRSTMLLLPVYLLPLVTFVFALGIVLAYAATFYRDLEQVVRIALAALLWCVPVLYHWSILPEPLQSVVKYNPLSLLVSPLQVVVHGGAIPTPPLTAAAAAVALAAAGAAWAVHRRAAPRLAFRL